MLAGRRRSPATLPRYARGRLPPNKGLQYPADPPSVEEIITTDPCLTCLSGPARRCTIIVRPPAGRVVRVRAEAVAR